MSEEVKFKINMPMFEDGELELFDNNIHNIIPEYVKLHLEKKEQILTQRIIMKQEEEIKELQERINKAIEYIKEHSTTIDYKTMRADYNLNMNDLLDILKGGNK